MTMVAKVEVLRFARDDNFAKVEVLRFAQDDNCCKGGGASLRSG
jgi:hypothetical protein